MSSSFTIPQNILPLCRNASPPNIFFSITSGRIFTARRMRSASVSSYAILNLCFSRRALSRLDKVFQAREEALYARIPFAADHQGVHQISDWAELQLVLHPLMHQSTASVRGERIAVLQAADWQRAFEKLKRDRLMWVPVGDLLLEPTARREVASSGRSRPLLGARDDLRLLDAGVVLIE